MTQKVSRSNARKRETLSFVLDELAVAVVEPTEVIKATLTGLAPGYLTSTNVAGWAHAVP